MTPGPNANPEIQPPVKALIVDLSERFGGASARVVSLLHSLPKGSAALAALEGSPVALDAQKAGCTVHLVGRRKTEMQILLRLVRLVREGGYRILDTQNIQSKFWASLAALLTGTSLISTLNSWYADEHPGDSLKGRLYPWLEFLTNWRLRRWIVVSRVIRAALLKKGFDSARVDLIYNAVEINPDTIPDVRGELIKEHNLPAGALICMTAGRLVWAKGHNFLVEACAQLAETKVYGFIVGDGELQAALEKQIQEAGLRERVKLLGYAAHERTLALLKACDIFVMSSNHEGTPVALLEAAALARPIVSTRVGGIEELVEDGEEALLVEAANPAALAASIQRLARDPELARRLGQAAQRRVAREFSLPALAAATSESYRKALGLPGGRSRS